MTHILELGLDVENNLVATRVLKHIFPKISGKTNIKHCRTGTKRIAFPRYLSEEPDSQTNVDYWEYKTFNHSVCTVNCHFDCLYDEIQDTLSIMIS